MSASHDQLNNMDADQVARNLRHMDDASIAEVIGGAMRGAVLDEVFRRMAEHVDVQNADGVDTLFRLEIEGAPGGGSDTFDVHIRGGSCVTSREPLGEPVSTLRLGAVPFLRLVMGGVSGLRLYEQGILTVDGDVAVAGSLRSLFAFPG